jgi:hypothetical protein
VIFHSYVSLPEGSLEIVDSNIFKLMVPWQCDDFHSAAPETG